MTFRFGLETILRLRASLEDHDRLRLQSLLSKQRELQREMEQSQSAVAALRLGLEQALVGRGVEGSEIQVFEFQRWLWERRGKNLEAELSFAATQIEHQRVEYDGRRRDRMMLENVRDAQFSRFIREQVRKEQAEVDELVLHQRGLGKARTLD